MKRITIHAYCVAACCAIWGATAGADEGDSAIEVHAQTTYIRQFKPSFPARYSGTNSLRAEREQSYTLTGTLFVGWHSGGTEIYLNPEAVQGAPFSDLHGLGGFSNGEVQRGAGPDLRAYRARLFLRQTWNLGGELEEKASDQNQVKTRYAAERLVLTAGNLSVLDVFDVMDYSRDARTQFVNWASLTYGAWDFAADARGYTWGAALEYISPGWQIRAGRFLVPVESNGLRLDWTFLERYSDTAEVELPYKLAGRPAIVRALGFRNRVTAGAYSDASVLGGATSATPDVAQVRRAQTKRGIGLSTQVEVTEYIGAYVRAGWNDGRTETFMFTEIDRSIAAGALLKGGPWGRGEDKVGVAVYANGLSREHRDYLGAGGLGFFLGDGQLSYGMERVLETFYSVGLSKHFAFSLGYQRIANPGYNRDRGPANFFGLRVHAEI
jgi:high affinity Mn2+ porin